MELLRKKNNSTKIVFPLIDMNNRPVYFTSDTWANLTNANITAYSWADNESPASLTISGTPSQLGITGLWELTLTQSEMNPDSGTDDYIIIKLNADEIDEQTILIKLITIELTDIDTKIDTTISQTDTLEAGQSTIISKVDTVEGIVDDILLDTDAIQGKLPSGTISDFDPTDTGVDGKTYNYVLELVMAMVNGRFKKDFPTEGNITFYKRDNLTVLFTVDVTEFERLRV